MQRKPVGTTGASSLPTLIGCLPTENLPKMSPEISNAVLSAWREPYLTCWLESRKRTIFMGNNL